MKRSLFLLQFRRTIVPFGLVFAATDVGIAILEWSIRNASKGPENIGDVASGVLAAIGMALAIPMGATAFSRDFKEKHHLFIHSLPLPLETMWAVINGANFTAMACCLVIMVALRPSMLTVLAANARLQDPIEALMVLMVLCICFLAGNCFALCFRRDLLAYLVAIFATGGMLGGIVVLAAICGLEPGGGATPHSGFVLVGLGCMVLLLAGLSRWFFVAGEITLLRVQFRNTLLTLWGLIGILLVLATAISLGLFSRFDSWVFERYGSSVVSPDGKYLLVVERREHHPQFARLTILDAQSGKLLRQTQYTGLTQARALSNGTLLTLADTLPLHRLFYLLPRSDALVRLPTGDGPAQETRYPSTSIGGWWWWQGLDTGKRVLLMFEKKNASKVVSFDAATGQVADTCAGESGVWVQWQREKDGVLVCFHGPPARGDQAATPASVWWLGETDKRIPWSGRATPEAPACVVNDVAFTATSACIQKVKELYPTPAAGAGVGGYLLPGIGHFTYVGEKTPVYYLRIPGKESSAILLVWNRTKSSWTIVAEDLPVHSGLTEALGKGYLEGQVSNPHVYGQSGVVVFYQRVPSGFAVYAYDADRGSTQKLGIASDPNPPNVSLLPLKDTLIIFIARGGTSTQVMRFRYEPQSGRLNSLSLPRTPEAWESVLYADDAGNQIVFRGEGPGRGLFRRNADMSEVQFWPRK